MKTILIGRRCLVLICVLFTLSTRTSLASDNSTVVYLASFELPPYSSEFLPNHGIMPDIITQAFAKVGKQVNFHFYPLARARSLVQQEKYDGVFPVTPLQRGPYPLNYSSPMPGINLVFFYKRRPGSPSEIPNGTRLGVVRGSFTSIIEDNNNSWNIVKTNSDEQSLLMLEANRIDYALINKYVAADLMVDKYPHLIGQLHYQSSLEHQITFHIGFNTNLEIQNDFNAGLQQLKQSGELDQILYRHGLLAFQEETGQKTLRIAAVANDDMYTMQELSRYFEAKNPDIKLSWRLLDENTLRRRLLSDLAVGDGQYDVMTIGAYETPIWADNHWLHPIQRLPTDYDLDDIVLPVRESLTSDTDTLFALPFYAESSVTYYRKDLFEQKGLKMPDRPTYREIKAFARRLHDPVNKTYGICLRGKPGWGENMALITTMVNTYGGQWFDLHWRTRIDTDQWERALTNYLKLLTLYGPPNPVRNGYTENLNLFSNGHCAMWIDASVAAGRLFNPKQSNIYDHVDFVQAPYAYTEKGSSWLWVWSLAIPSLSTSKEEAQKFIAWATSKEYIELVAKHKGWISAPPGTRYSTYANPAYQKEAPFAVRILDSIEAIDPHDQTVKPSPYKGVQFVSIPEFPALGSQVGLRISQALTGEISLSTALEESQELVNSKMRKAGYR